jgi:transposase
MYKSFIGIDVAKNHFDLYRMPDGLEQRFENNKKGIRACLKAISTNEHPLVVLEATGGYETTLACQLQDAGFDLAVVNPLRIRNFAKACGQLAKTDKLDARVIAYYAATLQPPPRQLMDKHVNQLKALVTRRQQLLYMHTAESNRREHALDKSVSRSINKMLKFIKLELDKVDKEIDQHIHNTPNFREKKNILVSAPSIGSKTSSSLLAKLPELGVLNRRKISALVGTAPINRDSGMFRGKRMTGGGRRSVRNDLYMPTLVAIRHNPVIKKFYQRLIKKGKAKMTAIIACMRKLLTILNSMIANMQPWDENYA